MTPKESMAMVEEKRRQLQAIVDAETDAARKNPDAVRKEISELRSLNKPNTAPVLGPTGMFTEGGRVIQVVPRQGMKVGGGRDATIEQEGQQEGKESTDASGDAQIQARDAQVIQRAEGEVKSAGDSHRVERERAVSEEVEGSRGEEIWVSRHYEAETKEALGEIIPKDAKAVTYKKIWQATALVRKG